jgi:hypothetical protein
MLAKRKLGRNTLFGSDENVGPHWLLLWKDYWYAIVSAFIGAVFGIAYARWDLASQRRKEQMLCVQRLRKSLQFNVDRLAQASGQLLQYVIPNYPPATGQLNYWLTRSHDILPAACSKLSTGSGISSTTSRRSSLSRARSSPRLAATATMPSTSRPCAGHCCSMCMAFGRHCRD